MDWKPYDFFVQNILGLEGSTLQDRKHLGGKAEIFIYYNNLIKFYL